MHPLTPDQRSLQLRARELAQGQFAPTAADTDRTEQYPWANVALPRDAGFMGMTCPRGSAARAGATTTP
ncbi:MAG TPA: acyl-CoA dehydrogenase family protein [Kofleriaceae bacterium]|nr:acyl-CoA dehydrogenase family protein [Kofleriaceae bacterium]